MITRVKMRVGHMCPGNEYPKVYRFADTAAFARGIDAASGAAFPVAAEAVRRFGETRRR